MWSKNHKTIDHVENDAEKRKDTILWTALLIMDNLLVHKKVGWMWSLRFIHFFWKSTIFKCHTQPLDLGIFAKHKTFAQNVNQIEKLSEEVDVKLFVIVTSSLQVGKSRCQAVRHCNFKKRGKELPKSCFYIIRQ